MKRTLYLLILLSCFACKQVKEDIPTPSMPKEDVTEETVSELYNYYIANPTHQYHINENKLIDYAVEHNLSPIRMDNGVYIHTNHAGKGDSIKWGDPLTVHYRGTFLDGKEFDSSYKRGKPITFRVGQMVKGWNYALETVTKGSKIILLIPSQMGYGEEGFDKFVPPNTNFVFELEILEE